MAVVDGHDPQSRSFGAHTQIRFVVIPAYFRPGTAVAPAVNGMKNDLCAESRKSLCQMRIVHAGTAWIGPNVIANQATDGQTLKVKRSQRL
jgi:hypothetical protein